MNAKALTTFFLALALSLPTTMVTSMSSAEAGPGSTLNSASKDGKRTHKRANAKRTKKSKKSSKKDTRSSSNRRTVRRTTTTQHSPRRTTRQTTRTRTVRTTPRRTVRRTTTRHSSHRHVTHRTRTRHVHHNTRTRTVHHHHHSSTSASASASSSRSTARSSGKSSIEAYITGGLGYSGFASPTITDDALPGAGYNVALGLKGDYIGFEFGFNGSGHTFDPELGSTDLAVLGLSGDLKLQPSFGFFEPYALAGLGGYSLQDGVINEASAGGAIRLGLGADFRFDDLAIGVRYLHSQYGFTDDSGIYGGDFGASSETLGANLSIYF